jgi:hypothetical protein
VNCPFCHFPNEPNAPFCVNCGAAMPAARPPRTQAQPQQQAQMPPPVTPAAPPPPPDYPPVVGPPPPATGYGQQQPNAPPAAQQPPVVAAPPAAVDDQPGAAPAAQPSAQDPAKTQPPIAKKKGGKGLIIAVVVIGVVFLVLVAAASVGYFVFMKSGGGTRGETKVTSTGGETGKGAETGKGTETGEEDTTAKGGTEKEGTGKEAGTEKTGGKGATTGTGTTKEANPALKKTALSTLYQSQLFRQNDKVKYAGATFSIRTPIRLLSKSALPAKAKLKKGKLAADVEIILYDKAKLKKFKVSLIDGSGKLLSPESDLEKVLELPEKEGERHMLWKKLAKSKKKSTTYLHRAFVIDEDKASSLIVEISNTNLDRALWIEVDSEKPL